MSQLTEKLRTDMFEAVKSKNTQISGIAQIAMSSIKNEEINKGEELTTDEELAVLRKEVKKLNDSITQLTAGGRQDLADESKAQADYLNQFLPAMMDNSAVEEVVTKVIADLNATSVRDMGRVMGAVMAQLKGQADGNTVKDIVSSKLSA